MLVTHLLGQFIGKMLCLTQHALVASASVHVKFEISAEHLGVGGIRARQNIDGHVVGLVVDVLVHHREVTHRTGHHIGVFHIGIYLKMGTARQRHGHVGEMETVEVGMTEVELEDTFEAFRIHQRIEVDMTVEKRVVTVYICLEHPSRKERVGGHPVEVVLPIAELPNLCLGTERRLGRQHVGALSIGLNMGSERTESHLRQKMLDGEPVCVHSGRILHQVGVEGNVRLHVSPTLAGGEVGPITVAIGFEMAVERDALRNVHLTGSLLVKQGSDKIHLGSDTFQVDNGLETVGVGEIRHIAVSGHLKCCRQRSVEILKLQPLHVAPGPPFDGKGLVGPFADKISGHAPHEAHEVLFAQISIHVSIHLARITCVERIEVHVDVCAHLRVGSLQAGIGQPYLSGVERHLARQLVNLYATFLTK